MTTNDLRQTGISFFLGAGASMDMGFPSGHRLKCEVARGLAPKSESPLWHVAVTHFNHDLIAEFAETLCRVENAAKSIDAIVEANREFCELARIAVWWTILGYEQRCNDRQEIEDYWFYRFLTRYYRGCKCAQDLWNIGPLTRSLVVNTLNYDRLAERTFEFWREQNFPTSDENAEAVVQHKHGSLQSLRRLPFGAPFPPAAEVVGLAQHLRFWFEKSSRSDEWDLTNIPIQLRETIAVLGFGYHKDIVSRFAVSPVREVNLCRIVATATNIQASEQREKIAHTLQAKFNTRPLTIELLPAEQGCREAVDRLFADPHRPGLSSRDSRCDGTGAQ